METKTRENLKMEFLESVKKMVTHIDDQTEIEEIARLWFDVFYEGVRIYSSVSEVLFEVLSSDSIMADEKFDVFTKNIESLSIYAIEEFGDYDLWDKSVEKVLDHKDLIRSQALLIQTSAAKAEEKLNLYQHVYESINNKVKEVSNDLREKEESIRELEAEFKTVSKKIEIIQDDSKGIQKEFVAILGIFASILLAAFGGLNILQNVMGNINHAQTGKLMLFSSLSIMGILLIVFLLLNGISKLTKINLRSCNCIDEKQCSCPMIDKHPTIFVSSILLSLISFWGISDYIIDYEKLFSGINDMVLLIGFIIFTFFIIILIRAIFWKHNSNKIKGKGILPSETSAHSKKFVVSLIDKFMNR